jgi:hypothetical protein
MSASGYAHVPIRSIGILLLTQALVACVPASITVQGSLRGRDGVGAAVPDTTLTITHLQSGNTDPRLRYLRSPIQNLDMVLARATQHRGLPFPETWQVLGISRAGQRPGAEPSFREFSGDPGWMRDHRGDLAWVSLRHRDTQIAQQNFSDFPAASIRGAGALVLARQEDDDPILPWRDGNGCAATLTQPLALTLRALVPIGAVDCFDMESLSSALLTQIAVVVTDVARDRGAIVRRHRLAVVPHLPTLAATPGGPTSPGFAFVYEGELEPSVGEVGVGAFTGVLTLSVPISLHWLRAADGTVTLLMDPIGASFGGTPTSNVARVTVSAASGSIAASFADDLRRGVSAGLAAAPLPTGPGGISLPAFLDLFFAESIGLGGNGRVPADFSVLALPSNLNTAGAPANVALALGQIAVNDVDGVTAIATGNNARVAVLFGAAGTIRVIENRNRAGTRQRRFDIPPPTERLAFDFVLLK